MKDFYRYIYKVRNGYQIKKDGIHYGWYEDITDALYDRDSLEKCNWDIEEWVWLPERENKYKKMRLPPNGLLRERQFIYSTPSGKWRIQKQINGKKHYFGSFDTLDEAIDERNKLLSEGKL